ncbi:MAG: DNA polymerase I [Armatimonadota bacterium]|nr:DNA polymerase I [Armatimonadota bacterium]
MPETLYLIDGHAQIFRAYYAIRGGMRSPVTGEPAHAVFGFTGMLLKLLSQFHPHYVVVAYDVSETTFRNDLFDQYKGTRNVTPEDLVAQVPRILEVVELFGLPAIGCPGLEADDIIATIVQRVLDDPSCRDINIRIVSKDKDLEQLLGERVTMFDIHTDSVIDVAWLQENKGIMPEQVVDILALTGDTVDNVPGVEGIGPKTAAQLIQQFGSIEGIFENIDQIKGKRRENLEKARAHLPLSRQLVLLKRDADFPFSLEAARVRPLQAGKILPLFQQLGFNRYQDEVKRLAEQTSPPVSRTSPPTPLLGGEGSLSKGLASSTQVETPLLAKEGPGEVIPGDYHAITTRAQLDELVATLRAQPIISIDTETTGLGRDAHLCGLSLAWQPGHGVYVPVRSPQAREHLDEATVLAALKPVLEDEALPKCGHNLKFDAGVLLRAGVKLRGAVFDSMLASILIDPTTPGQKLDYLAQALLGYTMIPISNLIGSGETQRSMDEVPLPEITDYAAEDADIALRLYHHMQPQLETMGMSALMRDVEGPLALVLAEMEANGILCDPVELLRQGEVLKERVEELRQQIYAICGCEFDLNSTKQLADVLYDQLGLKAGKKTKTGRSTDIQELERLAALEDANSPKTAVPRLVIEYRQLTKLISTYLGNLANSVDARTGRIHSTFHQLVTATGRLASHNPNLQNIPVRSDVGRQIRKAFKAPPGHLLICADYSQIELRLLAHFSEDEALVEAFRHDHDVHAAVAAQVFNTPLESVTREQRARAKTINFGIIYGVTPYGLARRIQDLDIAGATALIADYKRRFPGLDRFLQQCVHEALEKGYVCTILARRRAIPEIHAANANVRSLGERLAINSVVQGSAADLIKRAMVQVQRRIDRDRLPLKLLLQIHDELVLEVPAECAAEQARLVCDEMERAMQLRVPLRAECGVGPDWLAAK